MPTSPYDLILFDADDTLYDFARCEAAAFSACLQTFLADDAHTWAYPIYREVSVPIWRDHELGLLTLAELSELRWSALAQHCGFEYPVAEVAAAYLAVLAREVHLLEGAVAVCQALAQRHVLGIVTNGFDVVQRARLTSSPLADCISFIVTSESVGAAKPSALPFRRALELYARPVTPERVLMVGDNARSDIAGAHQMGFTTCWYNAAGRVLPDDIVPHYTITSLDELPALTGCA
ncbi:MAG: YjjG family noncanonical pyrimidine nucleotidase [Polyangiales bacterium]